MFDIVKEERLVESKQVFSVEHQFSVDGEMRKVKVSIELNVSEKMSNAYADGLAVLVQRCFDESFKAMRKELSSRCEKAEGKSNNRG